MPQPSYPYANIRVKAKELSLLNREKISRVADASTPEEAMQVLAGYGYPGAEETEPENFEECVSRELKNAYGFIEEISPDCHVTDLFLLQFDYHNLKAILKSELKGVGAAGKMLLKGGTIEPSAMYEAVREKNYSFFPLEMAEALTELDRRFAIHPDAALIGLLLDGAYARQIERELKQVEDKSVHAFYRATFDFLNLATLVRLKRREAGRDQLLETLLPGGGIPTQELMSAYDQDMEDMLSFLGNRYYQKELRPALDYYRQTGSFALLAKAKNDYLTRICAEHRENLFTIAPVLAYLVAKLREADAVRMVMLAKLNGIGRDEILELIPEID